MNTSPMRSPLAANATANGVGALTAVATPTAPDRVPVQDGAAARRFAELLRQSRSDRAPAAPPMTPAPDAAPRADAKDDPTPAADDTADAPAPVTPNATGSKASAPSPTRATGKAAVDAAHASSEPAPADAERKEKDDGLAAPTSTGERAATLAALAAGAAQTAVDPHAQRAEADVGTDASAGNDDSGGDIAGGARSQRAAQRGAADLRADAAAARTSSRASPADPANARAASATLQTLVGAAAGDPARAVADRTTTGTRSVAGGDAAALTFASTLRTIGDPQTGAAPAQTLAFATPIDAPDFAAALGVQVSLLARDGVQHAELHLNPAETGPLSIHIAVDGNAARIDFGADLAATRHAIEQGLPELASALRDAGLTLAGGGVSQHAGSRPDAQSRPAPHAHGMRESGDAPPLAATVRVSRRIAAGGVDLYA